MSNNDSDYRKYCDTCSGVYPPDEFEGILIEHWPNGQLKYRGRFRKNGRRLGQHLCFWENGVLEELSYWDEGWVCGTVVRFAEEGTRSCELDFGPTGGRTRNWKETHFSSDGHTLSGVRAFENNRLTQEWIDPEVAQALRRTGGAQITEEAVRMVYPDFEMSEADDRFVTIVDWTNELDGCIAMLRDSLRIAALPAQDQFRRLPDGCDKPYEIASEVAHWVRWAQNCVAVDLTTEQREALKALDSLMEIMSGQHKPQLWTESGVEDRLEWENVRSAAKRALHAFGWEGDVDQ